MTIIPLLLLVFILYQLVLKPKFIVPFKEGLKGKMLPSGNFTFVSKPSAKANSESLKEKGDLFEKYIVQKFNPKYFKIKEWRSDKYVNGIYAQSNSNPDLEIEFRLGDFTTCFAVECKWRQNLSRNKSFQLGEEWKMEKYRNFNKKRGIQVYFALGLDGTPDDPRNLYLIPLSEVEANFVSYDLLVAFVKPKHSLFYFSVENHALK